LLAWPLSAAPSLHACLSLLVFNPPAPPPLHTLSLHDALPISGAAARPPRSATTSSLGGSSGVTARSPGGAREVSAPSGCPGEQRSEEHTSELQSRFDLVCRLLLEKKKTTNRHGSAWPRTAGTT